jgi:hypothetical protein
MDCSRYVACAARVAYHAAGALGRIGTASPVLCLCLQVRKGRYKQTRTVANSKNPNFSEEFALIVSALRNDSHNGVQFPDPV